MVREVQWPAARQYQCNARRDETCRALWDARITFALRPTPVGRRGRAAEDSGTPG